MKHFNYVSGIQLNNKNNNIMSFLFPTFLYALAAISIPIIIHLFNFRRHKTVLFSDIAFLKNIKKETKSKSELKHLLILLARILAVASLVIAFAKPFIPLSGEKEEGNNDKVSVYIDNSFSMDAENKFGNLLEIAKAGIPDLVNSFNPNAIYQLTENTLSPGNQSQVNKNELVEMIGEIKSSGDFLPISKVISRQEDFFKNNSSGNTRNTQVLISDFQKASSDFENIVQADDLKTILIPLSSKQTNNIYIDSCYFNSPGRRFGETEELYVKIVNKSDEKLYNNPIKLFLNDSLRAIGNFSAEPDGETIVKLSYTNTQKGIIRGRLEINDYPITYDNELYFGYEVAEVLKILSISNKSKNIFVDAMFKDDDYFEVTHNLENQINFSGFAEYRLIILSEMKSISSGLREELEKYISSGGSVLLFPAVDINIDSYNQFFTDIATNNIIGIDTNRTSVSKIEFGHPLYENVFRKITSNIDLPQINMYYIFENKTRTNDEQILSTTSGKSILHKVSLGIGEIYISSVPFGKEAYEFSTHPVLLPAIYNMVLNSSSNNRLYYIIGKDNFIKISELTHKQSPIHLSNPALNFDFLPESRITGTGISLYVDNQITSPGNYFISSNEKTLGIVSYNYDRKESDMQCYTSEEIEDMIKKYDLKNYTILKTGNEKINSSLGELQNGIQLWKLFLLIAIFFLISEVLIIKLMK